ncbi:hypothetical protein JJQ59_34500 (plasmid) [Cupriavidus necator]|uniref:Uncharacterized protein n=1 Tax=Cupriavidus necator TaxID=106590 RepID=A0A367PMA2_CUPNE|nr:hypothetical protein JJQ59_34500 [Cupriavidus necator]RCJ09039.1 hypothetical protein DDK22_07795 [Cupriavidus necator]
MDLRPMQAAKAVFDPAAIMCPGKQL